MVATPLSAARVLEEKTPMPGHFHAVVWIDRKQARVFHFGVDEADKIVVHPEHPVRDVHHGDHGDGRRPAEDRSYFDAVANSIADVGAILIVGPSGEKHEFAKYLAEKRPAIRAHVEGVEAVDHPSDGQLLDFARRYVKAADRMRSQI
jgi:stalled ribosome rescue protein Dom34